MNNLILPILLEDCLEIQGDLKVLATVRDFIEEFVIKIAEDKDVSAKIGKNVRDDLQDLAKLAVTEAVTNIIKHAYKKKTEQKIMIVIQVDQKYLTIKLQDWGRDFDPESVRPPAFDGSRDGGFGMHIISQIAEEVSYSHDQKDGNLTRLKINLTEGN